MCGTIAAPFPPPLGHRCGSAKGICERCASASSSPPSCVSDVRLPAKKKKKAKPQLRKRTKGFRGVASTIPKKRDVNLDICQNSNVQFLRKL